MDFNALQKDLMDAAVVHAAAKKKARRNSSISNGSAFSTEREGPTIKDMYTFLDELGHGAYGSVMRARKRNRKVGGEESPSLSTPVGVGPGGYVGLHAAMSLPSSNGTVVGSPASSSGVNNNEPQFAIKIIDKKKAGNKGLSEVMGEVETMRLLNHPNIVKLEETFETDECLYIVMEYVPGGELHQVLKRTGPLPEATARQIIIQLLLAVEYIHQRGIVHRDLKPANMLLRDEQDWQIKLADFGFAVLVGTENCLTSYCGTGAYMAPEIVLDMNYGKAVDIWAVGVILYVIMSGDYPFSPSNGQNVASSIIANKWQRTMHPKIADSSPGAKDFLSKLLTTDSNKRLTAKEALKHTWVQAALQGLTHRVEAASTMGTRSGGNAGHGAAHVVPPKTRFRSWVYVIIASHRMVYWRKVRVLKQHHADVLPLKSFTYLVSGKYEPLHPRGVVAVAGIFSHNPNRIIPMFLLPLIEASSSVETLDVSDNNIDSVDTVQAIVKALINHPSLTNIFLENNPIPALAGRSLVRLARAPNRIRSIKLGGTQVGSDVLQQVAAVLKDKKHQGGTSSGEGGMFSTNSTNSLLSVAGGSGTTMGHQHHPYMSTSPIPPSSSNAGSSSALGGGRGGMHNHNHPTTPSSQPGGGMSSRSANGASSSGGSGSALSFTTRSGNGVVGSTTLISATGNLGNHHTPITVGGSVGSAGKRSSVSAAGSQHPPPPPSHHHNVVSPHGSQPRMTRFQPLPQNSQINSAATTTQTKLPPIPSSSGSGSGSGSAGGTSTSNHPMVPRKR